ncbi:hypothetical protein [Tardiphaga robiniae]|uniref:Uncharacterized protein n=1 Tax=Tardiphaga robiniae TaxID=943830 RepID=A0A7G6TVG4_9BRAD|nr:hypothetical protein [Tardiphaga robiniae]QND70746.1 hypothetical protein HB776_05480 [Tardiphaga robiniae]
MRQTHAAYFGLQKSVCQRPTAEILNIAVVFVRVDEAAYQSYQFADARPWQALATVNRVFRGAYTNGQATFYGGLGSTACDLGYGIPKPGDEWMVYVSSGDGRVIYAFPAGVAFAADPNIRQ